MSSEQAVSRHEPTALTPMDMLDRAITAGADIEVLEKLMALQERWEKNQARKAFDEAVAAAKAEIPPIMKNRQGHNAKKYADFAAIARVVDPIISKHGLSYRFRSVQDERITVTCILAHRSGHYEESTLSGPADATGNKNAIQAIGSTLSYLQRYSLVQALGLAASEDDDGVAADTTFISTDQVDRLIAMCAEVGGNLGAFCRRLGVDGLPELPTRRYGEAVAIIEEKRRSKA